MCGIAGFFGSINGSDPDALIRSLKHRGPDDHGFWKTENAILIHTRLSIIDLSISARQPMLSTSKRQGIVFNGEIYNYLALKSHIDTKSFKSQSDTEILLYLIIKYKEHVFKYLAGMYAFAFWDEDRKEGILARDPYGIKPLYYRYNKDGTLIFASESKVLRTNGDTVCPNSFRDTLLWGSVPSPQTLWSEIRQVPSGAYLIWDKGSVRIEHHSSLRKGKFHFSISMNDNISENQSISIVDCKNPIAYTRFWLEESIKRHLVSDVPVGIFLSGGIDSTVILALVRKLLGENSKIYTFSIGFHERLYNEANLAEKTAHHFKTEHITWILSASQGQVELRNFLLHLDLPTIDGFNTWCVSLLARREGMKVALSGVGGDELFGGYPSFYRVPQIYRLYHSPFRKVLIPWLARKPQGSVYRRLLAYLKGKGSWLHAYHAFRGIFTPDEAFLITKKIVGKEPTQEPFSEISDSELPEDPLSVIVQLETTRYLTNQLLRDSDIFSMAHGIELRLPLVDARLAMALDILPPRVRVTRSKSLLKKAVPEIPAWILRQPKRGFVFPFKEWLQKEFSEQLFEIEKFSPVPLNAWYRTWCLASVLKVLGQVEFK